MEAILTHLRSLSCLCLALTSTKERAMQRGPAHRLGHSVQHVIEAVRATRARREAVAIAEHEGTKEVKDPLTAMAKHQTFIWECSAFVV